MSVVLVTGGAGYVGSHAVKALCAAGHEPVVLDDLSAGHRAAIGDTPLVKADIRDTASVRDALRRYQVDAVMHFAALLAVGESVREPARYYDCNVRGSLSVLEAMVAEKVDRFVLSSSCAVYGQPNRVPIDETAPTVPINAYGDTKLAVERALPHYHYAYGLRGIALRYFNAAGADPDGDLGEDHSPEIHLIPRAIEASRGGATLSLFGVDYSTPDGTCQRDYIHVSDLATGHLRALEALERHKGVRAYNLGTGRPHSVLEVIRAVERVTGRRVQREIVGRRPGDPAILFAGADRVRDELGWTPRFTDLDEIVATAWHWHDAHPHGYAG